MVTIDIEKARYCAYCGSLLPKIQEKPSLEALPYEKCKSCGKTFIALTTVDIYRVMDILKTVVNVVLPSET